MREKREKLQRDIESNLPGILENHGITITKSDIRMIDQGSYKYNTTIKDDVVDRDVAVMIPLSTSDNSDPRKVKGYLRDSINISSRSVSIKEPCVRASYFENGEEWLHIDLPLYAEDSSNVYLARGKEYGSDYSWELADPDGLNDYLCGKINGNDSFAESPALLKNGEMKNILVQQMIMRVDVYYRFIGYVGDKTGDDMKAPQIRHRRWGKKNELVYEEGENPENE